MKIVLLAVAVWQIAIVLAADETAALVKATYSVTGLHCPPCTRTVESSLMKVKGVKSFKVDWQTKSAKVEFDEKESRASVTFVNNRELVMPVIYRVTYDDGSTEDRRLPVQVWYSANRWTASWETGGKRPVQVQIDPEDVVPDVNPENNLWVAPPPAATPKRK